MNNLSVFKKIFDRAPLPSLLLNPVKGRFEIAYVNGAFFDLTRQIEKEIIGQDLLAVYEEFMPDSGSRAILKNALSEVCQKGKLHRMQATLRFSDAAEPQESRNGYLTLEHIPIKSDTGKVEYIIHQLNDAEGVSTSGPGSEKSVMDTLEKLRMRNTFMEVILQNLPIGIAVNQISDGSATFVNNFFCDTYGWSEGDLSDIHHFFQKIYPDKKYREEMEHRIMTDIRSGDAKRMNWENIRITTSRGENRIVNAKNIPLPDQNLMISTVVDVTLPATQAAEMKRNRTNQEALINGTSDLIWSIDTDFRIIAANKAYLEMMKIATTRILGEGDFIFVSEFGEELNAKWKKYYSRALSGEQFSVNEQVFDPLSQRIEHGLVSFNPMRSANNQIFGVACYSKNITEEMENLAILAKAKDELSKIMDSSLDIICTIDKEGRFINLNSAAEKIWGYTLEELRNKPYIDLVHPDDVAKTMLAATDIMKGVNMTNFENRYFCKNGDLMPVLWSARWDAQEEIMYCIARDGTEKKQAERRLQLSEQRFRSLVQDASDMIAILDKNGVYLYVSPSALTILNLAPDAILGKSAFEFIHSEDQEQVRSAFANLAGAKKLYIPPFRFINKTGEWSWIETILTDLTDDPAVEGIVSNSRDVTERINALNQIKESNQRYQYVTKATSDAIWDWDLVTGSLFWGEGFETIFGHKSSLSRLQDISSWIEYLHPSDQQRVKQGIYAVIDGEGTKWKDEYRYLKADGSFAYVIDNGFVIRDQSGKAIRMVGAMQDVTDRKQAEMELKNYVEAIEKQNLKLQEIAWIQSHVVRAPLARIMGLIDLLKNHAISDKEKTDALAFIYNSSVEFDTVIRDIISKTEKVTLHINRDEI
jgi:PAS domain S-box-containing protein